MAGAKLKLAPLAVGVVSAVLLSAGCGGKSPTTTSGTVASSGTALGKTAYVTQMRAIGQSLSNALDTLSSATTAKKAATALGLVQGDLRAAAGKLDAISPPAPVASLHAKLAQAVRDFADELTPVIAKLQAGKLNALRSVTTLKGLQEIRVESTAITDKGYRIGG